MKSRKYIDEYLSQLKKDNINPDGQQLIVSNVSVNAKTGEDTIKVELIEVQIVHLEKIPTGIEAKKSKNYRINKLFLFSLKDGEVNYKKQLSWYTQGPGYLKVFNRGEDAIDFFINEIQKGQNDIEKRILYLKEKLEAAKVKIS